GLGGHRGGGLLGRPAAGPADPPDTGADRRNREGNPGCSQGTGRELGMTTQDPDELRGRIEETQRELSANGDALTAKLSPQRIVQDRVQRARTAVGSVKQRVTRSAAQKAPADGGTAVADGAAAVPAASAATGTVSTAKGTVASAKGTGASAASSAAKAARPGSAAAPR